MKILLTIFVVYLIFRLFARYVFPWLLKKFLAKKQQEFQEKMKDYQRQNEPHRKEGEVKIEHIPGKKKNNPNKGFDDNGEYVDFEEVE